jgi:hypothetical protein
MNMRNLWIALVMCGACKGDAKKESPAGPDPKVAVDTTQLEVKKIAFEQYPQWAAAHAEVECPKTIAELAEFGTNKNMTDIWGTPYEMKCGPTLPAGAKGFAVLSAGPDRKLDTADDIKSW